MRKLLGLCIPLLSVLGAVVPAQADLPGFDPVTEAWASETWDDGSQGRTSIKVWGDPADLDLFAEWSGYMPSRWEGNGYFYFDGDLDNACAVRECAFPTVFRQQRFRKAYLRTQVPDECIWVPSGTPGTVDDEYDDCILGTIEVEVRWKGYGPIKRDQYGRKYRDATMSGYMTFNGEMFPGSDLSLGTGTLTRQ